MSSPYRKGLGLLLAFFVLVLAGAFGYHSHFPQLVITGEASVGTWMSGALLIISATLCLITGMRHRIFPWLAIAAFFFVLALDERFMFHERLKTFIIFSYAPQPRWLCELPVIAGAMGGAAIALVLRKQLDPAERLLLAAAVMLGTASVIFDILAAGALWEDCFKLMAELLVACALLKKAAA